jgi:hypothetical protein
VHTSCAFAADFEWWTRYDVRIGCRHPEGKDHVGGVEQKHESPEGGTKGLSNPAGVSPARKE